MKFFFNIPILSLIPREYTSDLARKVEIERERERGAEIPEEEEEGGGLFLLLVESTIVFVCIFFRDCLVSSS